MPKIIVDGKEIECREGLTVLRAALEGGIEVPHYCYHPGLSVVASCRLCLMEMKVPDPQTGNMVWSPRLFPACQTPVKDGMEVRFHSENVRRNQRAVMEDYLLNHPLDCPVCDQAGECWLQDYSFKFGKAVSRTIEPKLSNPKKNIGSKTLLYQDRCVLCTRCVRFTREIAGTSELCVIRRGYRAEIDCFPGKSLENKLQGNVVDLCPVGALLDKRFLFKQRVWFLRTAKSVCPRCSTGCTIRVDHSNGRIYRLRPRANPKVNTWWMCDEGRFGWDYVHCEDRLGQPKVRKNGTAEPVDWDEAIETVQNRLRAAAQRQAGAVAVVLSPMMTCEEAWLLAKAARAMVPEAILVLGPVPRSEADEIFPVGASEADAKFIIRAEKCPNRRGVEAVIKGLGGAHAEFADWLTRAERGEFAATWIVGGYPEPWVDGRIAEAAGRIETLIVQDILPNELTNRADVLLPSCSWAEREGCFVNYAGIVQPFERAIEPPLGCLADGQYLYRMAGHEGLYQSRKVREMMAEEVPLVRDVYEPPDEPKGAH